MSGASRQNTPSEKALRQAYDLFPGILNCSWFTSGGTGNLAESAIEYADLIIERLVEFKKLQRGEIEARNNSAKVQPEEAKKLEVKHEA